MSFVIFFKNNRRNIRKNKLRTFEARGNENFKNLELQEKKSGSYKKKVQFKEFQGRNTNNTTPFFL